MPMNKTERLWKLADVMGRNIIWTRKYVRRWEREIDSLGAFLKYKPVEQTIGRREALVLKLQAVVDIYQALIDKLEE